jgi:putative FmdB family regulatory protein
MAIYNYQCKACKTTFSICSSILNKIPDNCVDCPNCKQSEQVKRIYDKFSFTLKGSGFYRNDYAKKEQ